MKDTYPQTLWYRIKRSFWLWRGEAIVLTTVKPSHYHMGQFIRIDKSAPIYEVTRIASGNGLVWDVWGIYAADAEDLPVGVW